MTFDIDPIHTIAVQRTKDPRQRLSRVSNRNTNTFIMLFSVSCFPHWHALHNAKNQVALSLISKLLNLILDIPYLPFQIQPPASPNPALWISTVPLPCSFWLASGKPWNQGEGGVRVFIPWLPPHQLDESLQLLEVSVPIRQLSAPSTLCPGSWFQEELPLMAPPGLAVERETHSYWP